MKKITLLLLFFVSITVLSQEKKTYDIGILTDIASPELTPLLEELKNEITSVVGEEGIIRFSDEHLLSNDLDLVKAAANYQELLNSDVDIFWHSVLLIMQSLPNKKNFPNPLYFSEQSMRIF